jgi:3'5'-cyclic nucleotide phosphodiesterase
VLEKEDPRLAAAYKHKSIAEQNSLDLSWNTLMDPCFSNLRQCIYSSEAELARFRQILVNSVMATDIFDKELGLLRKKRWETAFSGKCESADVEDAVHRKATIVLEHLIQASDVAHTMQHWHIYQKWNERLFEEMYTAYLLQRTDKDPSVSWFQGEIGFFDNYIIPLAKKLKDCGVFGVASDEYLTYAVKNRHEWEKKGVDIVEKMVSKMKKMTEHEKVLI